MYTKEDNNGTWSVLDPYGDLVINVSSEGEADTLLSHLNR